MKRAWLNAVVEECNENGCKIIRESGLPLPITPFVEGKADDMVTDFVERFKQFLQKL